MFRSCFWIFLYAPAMFVHFTFAAPKWGLAHLDQARGALERDSTSIGWILKPLMERTSPGNLQRQTTSIAIAGFGSGHVEVQKFVPLAG